jgi:hypothetical protein
MMPVIQVTSLGTDAPRRHTVSSAGALLADDAGDEPALLGVLELLEHAVIVSAAAAPSVTTAAGIFLSPTEGTPSR